MGHMSVSTTIGIHVCMASCEFTALPRGCGVVGATDQACITTDALEGAGEARLTEFELGDAKLSCGVKNVLERR